MSRRETGADPDGTERTIDRVAHAFTPAEWSGRWLVVGIVVFAAVATLTVVQRALLAESPMGWIITSIHGTIVVTVVPALTVRTVRDWRRVQASTGVPE